MASQHKKVWFKIGVVRWAFLDELDCNFADDSEVEVCCVWDVKLKWKLGNFLLGNSGKSFVGTKLLCLLRNYICSR